MSGRRIEARAGSVHTRQRRRQNAAATRAPRSPPSRTSQNRRICRPPAPPSLEGLCGEWTCAWETEVGTTRSRALFFRSCLREDLQSSTAKLERRARRSAARGVLCDGDQAQHRQAPNAPRTVSPMQRRRQSSFGSDTPLGPPKRGSSASSIALRCALDAAHWLCAGAGPLARLHRRSGAGFGHKVRVARCAHGLCSGVPNRAQNGTRHTQHTHARLTKKWRSRRALDGAFIGTTCFFFLAGRAASVCFGVRQKSAPAPPSAPHSTAEHRREPRTDVQL